VIKPNSSVLGSLLMLFAVGVAPSGAAEEASTEEPFEFPPEIEKLLTETSDSEDYAAEERCLQTRSIRGTQILDDQHVVFRMPGESLYLVRFKHRCLRLTKHSTLVYETHSSRLCRLDAIRASDSTGWVGPPCSIPGFVEITRDQVTLLDDSLKAQRDRKR
jgi:hypothetical protein